ncbi:lipocalin family protein [Cohnella zeiphila]|uniref:AttH domain-containing protein n=1 Tax=Cohnella zeiphila TaxID=2761120 RepID=A0A7X0SL53_9BACL|nr:lipocalin family protein [Cohnella zeiphila]MBB6730814.1 hypothetical protein [Cohnella zeiphila]
MNVTRSMPKLGEIAEGRPAANLEWWYAYAFLTGNGGKKYALVASFFRVGELPVVKGHYLIHSFIRLDEDRYEPRSSLDRTLAYQMAGFYLPLYFVMKPGDRKTWSQYMSLLQGSVPPPHLLMDRASVTSGPSRLAYGDSGMTFPDDPSAGFDVRIADKTRRVDLRFLPAKPVSSVDEEGSLNGLKYYSVTRNQVYGELRGPDGEAETLRGEGWFDRQWGQNYDLLRGRGWDWFGLQLEDGRELIVSRLRRTNSAGAAAPVAKLILEDGDVRTSDRVEIRSSGSWKSLYSGFRYPAEWRLAVPDFGLALRVAPLMPHQEIPIPGPIQAIWEGACAAAGESRSAGGAISPIRGRGFAELVGYADE